MKSSRILSYLQSQMKRITDRDSATKYFEQQQEALDGIRDTAWMLVIKDYFYREYDSACTALWTIDAKDTHKVAYHQAQMNNAKSFLAFMDNVST